jgi:hypothetical protein
MLDDLYDCRNPNALRRHSRFNRKIEGLQPVKQIEPTSLSRHPISTAPDEAGLGRNICADRRYQTLIAEYGVLLLVRKTVRQCDDERIAWDEL